MTGGPEQVTVTVVDEIELLFLASTGQVVSIDPEWLVKGVPRRPSSMFNNVRRARQMQALCALIVANMSASVSLVDVCRLARCSKRSFYDHFISRVDRDLPELH